MSRRYSVILLTREQGGIGVGPGPEGTRQLATGLDLARVLEGAIRELKVLLVQLRNEQQSGENSKRAGG